MAIHEDTARKAQRGCMTRRRLERDETLTAEELRVRLWRFDQLAGLGYSDLDAFTIASDATIDLELARRLVSKLGCPLELAARILV